MRSDAAMITELGDIVRRGFLYPELLADVKDRLIELSAPKPPETNARVPLSGSVFRMVDEVAEFDLPGGVTLLVVGEMARWRYPVAKYAGEGI